MLIAVTVLKWDKFNPRADRGNFAWFRFQNTYFSDQAIFGLLNNAKLLFIFLCCEASKYNNGEIALDTDYIGALLKFTDKEINTYLSALCSSGLVNVLKSSSRESDLHVLVANGTERNETERDGTEQDGHSLSASADELAESWNAHCGSLPKVQRLTGKRATAAKARLKDNPNLEYWHSVVERMAASPFCQGNNNTGWRASFDFLLKPDTHIKVMEGKYDGQRPKTKAEQNSVHNADMFAAVERGEL